MPLLMCPNDNASMQTVRRGEVEFDMCPQCRGVWLDRGELEKLLAEGRQAQQAFQQDVDEFRQNPQQWTQRHPYDPQQKRHRYDDDDDYRRHGGHGHYKKRRGFDLFDIFD